MYNGPNGTIINACKNGSTFTIRINDAEDTQIGMMENIVDIPRGLILAEGYVAGYYAGMAEGNKCMYQSICDVLGTRPNPEALEQMRRRGYAPVAP